MKTEVRGLRFACGREVRDVPALRESFFELAREVFSLDFAPWHRGGYWGEEYRPYVLCSGERVVSCVAVNDIRTRLNGAEKRFVQLGTVMTHPEWRGRGLSRFLMERALADAADADGVYLFANDSVLDFYPRFGFRTEGEFQCRTAVPPRPGRVRKLCMDIPADREALLSRYRSCNNPYSSFPLLENQGLLMFYCGNFWKDGVYLLEDTGLAAITFPGEAGQFLCCELFGEGKAPLSEALGVLAAHFSAGEAVLGFPPADPRLPRFPYREEDTTLFVLEGRESPCPEKGMLPLVSYA